MGHQHSKTKKDFHEQRKVLVDDIIKVENELKDLNKRKSELAAKEGDDYIDEEDHIHFMRKIRLRSCILKGLNGQIQILMGMKIMFSKLMMSAE